MLLLSLQQVATPYNLYYSGLFNILLINKALARHNFFGCGLATSESASEELLPKQAEVGRHVLTLTDMLHRQDGVGLTSPSISAVSYAALADGFSGDFASQATRVTANKGC